MFFSFSLPKKEKIKLLLYEHIVDKLTSKAVLAFLAN